MARPQSPDYDKRRAKILETAARLFAKNGFHAASIGQLATACGMSKSLIYHYYGSKTDILFACMEDHVVALKEICQEIRANGGDPKVQLRDIVRTFLDIYKSSANNHKVLLNELSALPDDQRSTIIGHEDRVVALLGDVLSEASGQDFDPKYVRTVCTMLLLGMINWTSNWFRVDGPLTSDQIADLATDIFMGGLEGAKLDALKE